MKRLLIILVLLGVGAFLIAAMMKSESNIPEPKPLHRLSYAGSIGPETDMVELGTASFKQNYQKLSELSLYWYNLDTDNKITRDPSVTDEIEKETISFAKQNDKKVLMGIGDHGEAEKADAFLVDKSVQNVHIAFILSLIDEKGYDGVIIDYEDLSNEQEKDFTQYMRTLSQELHAKGKLLMISAPVETQGKVFHGINIVEVSKVVDSLHLVAYEEYGSDSPPGPIASIGWVTTIIKNALKQGVPPDKIVLGTAHSGHDWIVEPTAEFFKDMHTKETLDLLARTQATLTWSEERQANYFEYRDGEESKHVVWLEDAQSIKAKVELAKAYQLKGLFIWYLGGEDPAIWEAL